MDTTLNSDVCAKGMLPEEARAEYVRCVQALDPAFKAAAKASIDAESQPATRAAIRSRRRRRKRPLKLLAGLIAVLCWALLVVTVPLARVCAEAERAFGRGATAVQDALRAFDLGDAPVAHYHPTKLSRVDRLTNPSPAVPAELASTNTPLQNTDTSDVAEEENPRLREEEEKASSAQFGEKNTSSKAAGIAAVEEELSEDDEKNDEVVEVVVEEKKKK
jgi:hypothetical protein